MSEPFHGVLPALITPFTNDGSAIDTDALGAIVERLIAAGAGGLVPGGSTGEFTTLSHAERRQLTEATVEAAAGRVPVVAGTGALSTAETVELSVHAQQAGAAAVMVVPPFYDALSWRELLAHYNAVADAIEIPIMYYNLPSATGVKLSLEQFRELPVSCLKDTGGDAVAATELIQNDGPTLLNGWDTLTFAALAAGVRAVVWALPRSSPSSASSSPAADRRHRPARSPRAVGTAVAAVPVPRSTSYSAAVKTACAIVGDITGPVRARCSDSTTTPPRARSPRSSSRRPSRQPPASAESLICVQSGVVVWVWDAVNSNQRERRAVRGLTPSARAAARRKRSWVTETDRGCPWSSTVTVGVPAAGIERQSRATRPMAERHTAGSPLPPPSLLAVRVT